MSIGDEFRKEMEKPSGGRTLGIQLNRSNPAILVVLVTGIWMTFAGHWSGRVWPWTSLALVVLVFALMVYVARPYYMARDAMSGPDEALAARLAQTKPRLALWIGVIGLVMLFGLMVFKPF